MRIRSRIECARPLGSFPDWLEGGGTEEEEDEKEEKEEEVEGWVL
jgi:hypothetical protein